MRRLSIFRTEVVAFYQAYKLWLRLLCFPLWFLWLFLGLDLCFPFNVEIEYSRSVYDRKGELLQTFLSYDEQWRLYLPKSEITKNMRQVILRKEDRWFYYHPGVNPISVARALFSNITRGKRVSGASTITMQLARMLEPKRRNYWAKLIETFRAFQLEWYLTKDEILRLYLNKVPYGGNIEGIKSASLFYFGKNPDHLSSAEVVLLAVIPNRPNSLRPGKNSEALQSERDRWLDYMFTHKIISRDELESGLREPIITGRRNKPEDAPIFCRRVILRNAEDADVYTTLDLGLQKKCEEISQEYIRRLYTRNIHNASVMVIDNRTHEVLVYVGSTDYADKNFNGQVDGVKAIRQPGSTLKPLIYGMGIDKGMITPKSILFDVPVNYKGYRPENYDKSYSGYVSVENALAQSLNIPAVRVLDQIKVDTLLKALIHCGFKQIEKDKKELGLSVALGGCGVRLEELCGLYSAFANYGIYKPLKFLQNEISSDSLRILSEATSFVVHEMLSVKERADFPLALKESAHLPRIAWKTGTSYGRRDAWCIGYNRALTVGVWIGNFSGEGVADLSGTDVAAPLLFQLFHEVQKGRSDESFVMPRSLLFRYVCPESGLPQSNYCENHVMDYFIPLVSPTQTCSHIKEIQVSPDNKISFCKHCLPSTGYKNQLYHVHEPAMIDYFERQQLPVEKIPEHNPECSYVFSGNGPEIQSPVHGMHYLVDKNDIEPMLLSCNPKSGVKEIHWYVNKSYYKSCKASEKIFFTPSEGVNEVSVSDDRGRNSVVRFEVHFTDL